MKQLKRIAIVTFAVIVFAVSFAWNVSAENEKYFCLTASNADETLIEPVRVAYEDGQTIIEALSASGYSFEYEGAFISKIQNTLGSYTVCCDNGGYDLTAPASSVTAVIFSERSDNQTDFLPLVCTMCDYLESDNNVQNYANAKRAYERALAGLKNEPASEAKTLISSLDNAMREYKNILNGTKYMVNVMATQNGTKLTDFDVTLTDQYGNVTFANGNPQVIAGAYSFCVSDGGHNRTEGTVSISAECELSVTLPGGEWFGEVKLLDADKEAYQYENDKASYSSTYFIPDTVGIIGVRLNAMQGKDIPDEENTKLRAIYEGINASDMSGTNRNWESQSATLNSLVVQGMEGRRFRLEAQYKGSDGYTQIQSYGMTIERIPTLSKLAVTADGTNLPMEFSGTVYSYALKTVSDSVTVSAIAYDEQYEINGTGSIKLAENTKTQEVTVSANGKKAVYTITIEKTAAVNVTISAPQNTSVAVYNRASSLVLPQSGAYRLVPGEEYECVGTKNTCYHTSRKFTASEGLTVSVSEPDTTDRLMDFALYNGSASTRIAFDVIRNEHTLTTEIPDVNTAVYAQATAEGDYSVEVKYVTQLGNAQFGTDYEKVIDKPVSSTGSCTILSYLIGKCGYSQNAVIRLSKTDGETVYYQDYELKIYRTAHLTSFVISDTNGALPLMDDNGTVCDFNRDKLKYKVSVDRSEEKINISCTFVNENDTYAIDGGYYALINGTRFDSLRAVSVPLDTSKYSETVIVTVCHKDESMIKTDYSIEMLKTDPVAIAFKTEPENTIVSVINNQNGRHIYAEKGAFMLSPNTSYTYTVTANGYVGVKNNDFTAPEQDGEISITLNKAVANNAIVNYDASWPSFRADEYNNGVVNAKTPQTAENTVLSWATKLGEGYSADACGCPIIVGGYLYTYAGTEIFKIDTVSGEVVAQGVMDHASSFAINTPTYADGMIFVGESDGTIQAFNAATLESLWIYHDANKGQPNCPIVYKDGYIYTGFWLGEEKTANFVALSVTDEDISDPKEEKIASWTYSCVGGFYWAGAYAGDKYILVPTDDGKSGYTKGYASVVSIERSTGRVISEIKMPVTGDIRCSIEFEPDGEGAQSGKCYFTSKGGYFFELSVNADGTFADGSLKTLPLYNYANDPANPPMSTCTPTVYNGRAYVGISGTAQFGAYSGHNICVIDLNRWKIAYTIRTQGYPQTSGMLTTAYEEESGYVYIYFFDNYTPGKLRMIKDKAGQTSADVTVPESYTMGGVTTNYDTAYVLFTPYAEQAQYAICSPITDEYGNIYFKNDSAYLMALTSTVTKLEVTRFPDRTQYAEGDRFDGAGMSVTAYYSNGMQRDVTKYVEWSEETLTRDDTEFTITFPYAMYHDENRVAGTDCEKPIAVIELTISENDVVYGDVNGDGKINDGDARLVYDYYMNKTELSAKQVKAADVDKNGTIDIFDATLIYFYGKKLIESFAEQ